MVRSTLVLEKGARVGALLEQKPISLGEFVLLPLGCCERRRSLRSERELVVGERARSDDLVTLTRVEVENVA